jgi:SAM-dependent methyltransferase
MATTLSTTEQMRAVTGEAADESSALRRVLSQDLQVSAADHRPPAAARPADPPGTITTDDGITIIPSPGDVLPYPPGTRMSDEVTASIGLAQPARLRPMHPLSIPDGLTRTVRYLSLLRQRPEDPETYQRFLAADTIGQLHDLVPLRGARAVDIGGQAGFMAEALRDEGADCLVLEHPGEALAPHDGQIDRVIRGDGGALPLADRSFDLVYCSEVLSRVAVPHRLLDEIARVLVPETGVGYVAFTNRRSPLARYQPGARQHPVRIADVLSWFFDRDDLELITADPRFWPVWANRVVGLPVVREVATGSLRIMFRVRG